MSSPVASTFTPKVSKNPGLTLDLMADTTGKLSSNLYSFTRPLPSAISSLSNTPALEPDWIEEDDTSDDGDSEVQYILISSNSPFYRPPATPHTSSYISVGGFPFACDALAEEDPLFVEPAFEEPESDSGDKNAVVIAGTDLTEDPDSQSNIEWKFTETLDQVKPTRMEIDNQALRPIF